MTKPLLCLLALLGLLSPAVWAESSASLEVMSYNIRTGRANDGLDAWPVRKHRTIALLEKHSPDIIGLQEAWSFQIEDLQKACPGYEIVGTGRADGREGNEFSPVMYNTKRLQLLRTDTFWLSDRPEEPGSMKWGNYLARICTWAYFRDRETGRFFYIFNTHLDHISQGSREESVRLILRRAGKIRPKDPVIITGDFNASEENPVVELVNGAGYRDTFRMIHPNEKVVGTTNAFAPERQPHKIDYVFVDSAWVVDDAAIIDDKIDGRWPSDHLPVTATIRLK